MVIIKRKKVTRQRGLHTHGWGSMKKHRGAGNRGGVGRAGSGKRGDAKKPSYWKERQGKIGFTSWKKKLTAINISALERQLPLFIKKNIAADTSGKLTVDLKKAKIHKLLGAGRINTPLRVVVSFATKKAQERIVAAGGEVVLPQKKSVDEATDNNGSS